MNPKQPFMHKPYFGVLDWKSSGLGVRAEIACHSLDENGSTGQEVHRDTVKLHEEKQRLKFANAFFSKLPVKSEDRDKFVLSREEELRKIANRCRNIDREADAQKVMTNPPPQQPPPMTDDEKNNALILLKDPALLFNALSTAKDSGIVGEEETY